MNNKAMKYISENMKKMLDGVGAEMSKYLLQGMNFYEKEYKKYKETVPREAVAHNFNLYIDKEIESAKKEEHNIEIAKKIRCKAKCNHCCKIHVGITDDEAYLMLRYAKEKELKINIPKLQRQADKTVNSWNDQSKGDQICVFLGMDGLCKVYEHRPIACRKYLVLEDPKHCNPITNKGRKVQVFNAYRAETIASALMNATEYGSLPKMLLKEIKESQ